MMQQKLSDILIWGEKKPKTPKRLPKKYIHCEQDIRQRLQNCACGAIILAFSFRKAAYARLTHVLYCHKGDDVTKTFWHFNSRRKENQKEKKKNAASLGPPLAFHQPPLASHRWAKCIKKAQAESWDILLHCTHSKGNKKLGFAPWFLLWLWFNLCLLGQNGIWSKFYHFWPKNDGEKWSRKFFFEIPPCAYHFLLNEFTSKKGGILIKSTNSVIKMT